MESKEYAKEVIQNYTSSPYYEKFKGSIYEKIVESEDFKRHAEDENFDYRTSSPFLFKFAQKHFYSLPVFSDFVESTFNNLADLNSAP